MKLLKHIRIINCLLILFCLVLFGTSAANAQPKNKKQNRDALMSMKVGYLTKELSLTPDEAEKFWPMYNEYTEKKSTLSKKTKDDGEYEKMLDDMMVKDQQKLEIIREFQEKLKTILPAEKIVKLFEAEKNFKKMLLQEKK